MTNYDAPFVELVMFYFNGANIDSETMHKMYIAYKKGIQVGLADRVKTRKATEDSDDD